MYLIRIEMDNSLPEIRRVLGDCEKLHGLVMRFFGTRRLDSSVLYRINSGLRETVLYLYAAVPADENAVKGCRITQREVSNWLQSMKQGTILHFDLTAIPSKKVQSEGKKNSKRRLLQSAEERQAWMERKAGQNGFAILALEEFEAVQQSGRHHTEAGGSMVMDGYHYRGILQITDEVKFRQALSDGIGAGKAYGYGMLMVKGV